MDYNIINKNSIKIIMALKGSQLYFNQISESTGIKSRNNLVKNLGIMAKAGILKKEKNKSNTFYEINYDNNIALSILNLINNFNFQNLPFERRKAIEEVIVLFKPNLAVLFGSTAKGDFKKQSDIDLLFVYNRKDNIKVNEIASRYGVKINPIIMEFNELDKKNETIRHILKTGYPLTGHVYFYKILRDI